MKKILGLVVSLTVISGICASVLAYVDAITKAPIADIKVKQAEEAVRAVMPAGVVTIEQADGFCIGKDAEGQTLGYASEGRDPGGYGGDIVLMVGFKADKKTLVCYKTLVANETPGLGTKLASPEFANQFGGKDATTVKLRKDGGEIDAITSATITSKAVLRVIAAAQKALK